IARWPIQRHSVRGGCRRRPRARSYRPTASSARARRARRASVPTRTCASYRRALRSTSPVADTSATLRAREPSPSRSSIRAVAVRRDQQWDVIVRRPIGDADADDDVAEKWWIGDRDTGSTKVVAYVEGELVDPGFQTLSRDERLVGAA